MPIRVPVGILRFFLLLFPFADSFFQLLNPDGGISQLFLHGESFTKLLNQVFGLVGDEKKRVIACKLIVGKVITGDPFNGISEYQVGEWSRYIREWRNGDCIPRLLAFAQ